MSWFCSVGEKSFNQKDSTERHVMSKHCYAGLTPFQIVLMFSQKCQRFHFDHPFTSMIAGMTGSGKTTSNNATSFRDNLPSPGEDRLLLFTVPARGYRNASRCHLRIHETNCKA